MNVRNRNASSLIFNCTSISAPPLPLMTFPKRSTILQSRNRLLKFGEGREWRLIEKLAEDIAATVLSEFHPARIRVEVKKFIIPQTRYISVVIERP